MARGNRPKGTSKKYSVEAMIDALHQAKGMNTVASRILHCSLSTVENYVKAFPAVAEARRQEREALLDAGELSLLRAIQNGEAWAVCFALKTVGKSRGYIERQEVSGPGGGAIEIDVGMTDDQRAEKISGLLDLARERAKRAAANTAHGRANGGHSATGS